jgi:thiamine transport system ATP-binding protein
MLELDAVSVRLGGSDVVCDVSLAVEDGSTVALLGPSGCGKTTLLRAIAGLQTIDRGQVRLDGVDLVGTPPHERNIGLMFQDYALFPHRDVVGNVEFGLRMRHMPAETRRARVQEVLALVGLQGFEHRSVSELSGGERQRVALARSLAPEPRVLMLDEPLGSLDRTRRDQLVLDLRELFTSQGLTVIYVTHDQAEALALADHVAVINAGRIAQFAPPPELWAHPSSPFVARFLGFSNLVAVEVRAGEVHGPFGVICSAPDGPNSDGPNSDGPNSDGPNSDGPNSDGTAGAAVALVRPTAIRLNEGSGTAAVVRSSAFAGDHTVVELATADGTVLEATIAGASPSVGTSVGFDVDPAGVQLFASTE